MKAAQLTSYDGPSAIVINEVETPSIESDQVLVEVKAAAINPFDLKVSQGALKDSMQLPATLGGDVAGVISQIGSDATGFTIGQEVFGQANAVRGNGSFAEFTPVNASSLAAKPTSIDFAKAAAFPLVAVSAYQALVTHAKLEGGQKVLIHGGAGGIGSQAIQIAKHLGAHVVTTARAEDTNYVKSLGADEVIDYTTQKFTDVVSDCDVVFDTVGGETNTQSYEVLKPGGKLVSMLVQPNEELMAKYKAEAIYQSTKVTTEALNAIRDLIDTEKLQINVDKIFPLDQASEAMAYLAAGHVRGKVVLNVT